MFFPFYSLPTSPRMMCVCISLSSQQMAMYSLRWQCILELNRMLETPNSAIKFHQYTNSNKQRLLNNLIQICYMLKPYIYHAFILNKKLTKLGDKINCLLKSLFTPKQDAKFHFSPQRKVIMHYSFIYENASIYFQ